MNYIQLKKLKKFPIFRLGRYKGGLIYMQENRRVRPHQNLAGRLIGYTSKDINGNVVGIEGAYNDQLAGITGCSADAASYRRCLDAHERTQ